MEELRVAAAAGHHATVLTLQFSMLLISQVWASTDEHSSADGASSSHPGALVPLPFLSSLLAGSFGALLVASWACFCPLLAPFRQAVLVFSFLSQTPKPHLLRVFRRKKKRAALNNFTFRARENSFTDHIYIRERNSHNRHKWRHTHRENFAR